MTRTLNHELDPHTNACKRCGQTASETVDNRFACPLPRVQPIVRVDLQDDMTSMAVSQNWYRSRDSESAISFASIIIKLDGEELMPEARAAEYLTRVQHARARRMFREGYSPLIEVPSMGRPN